MTFHNVGNCIDRVRGCIAKARFLLAAILVSAFSLLPLANVGATAQTDSLKQTPTAQKESNNGITAPIPGKAESQTRESLAPITWNVSLSASSTNLWPKQYTLLTATANQDVGPTPYYISIYDGSVTAPIKVCGIGTTCSISVTQPNAATHNYKAYISAGYPTTNPPASIAATSNTVTVIWRAISVSLQASPTTLGVNSSSTLTATTSTDVWPTPFYTQIYDATTGVRLRSCASGTTCSVSTSQAVATTHRFVAYVSDSTVAYPPTSIQATSNSSFVTWTNGNYRVNLTSAPAGTFQRTLTATSNINVGPTPYYIEIFNARTGTRIAICGTGTTCSTNVSTLVRGDYVAFISANSTTLPPASTQASSNVISLGFTIILPNGQETSSAEQ